MIFYALIDGAPLATLDGLWIGPPGGVELLARKGSPAPDSPAGTVYQVFGGEVINRVGMAGLRLPPLPHHPACGSAPGGSSKTR